MCQDAFFFLKLEVKFALKYQKNQGDAGFQKFLLPIMLWWYLGPLQGTYLGRSWDQFSMCPKWLTCCSSCAPAVYALYNFKFLTLWLIALTPVLFVAKWYCNVNLWEADLRKHKKILITLWWVLIFRGHWMLTYFTYSCNSGQNRQSTETHTPWIFLLFLLSLLIICLWLFISQLKFVFPFLSPKPHKQIGSISHFFCGV